MIGSLPFRQTEQTFAVFQKGSHIVASSRHKYQYTTTAICCTAGKLPPVLPAFRRNIKYKKNYFVI